MTDRWTSDRPVMPTNSAVPEPPAPRGEVEERVELRAIDLPDNTLNVHFDVNQYLEDHSEENLWVFLGQLRDMFRPVPESPWD